MLARRAIFRRTSLFVRLFSTNNKGEIESGDLLRDIISNRQSKVRTVKVNDVKNRNLMFDKGASRSGPFPRGKSKINHNLNKKKRIVINWNSGTERAQDAANKVIREVFKLNSKGSIKIFDEKTHKLETSNIKYYAKGLDLDKLGVSIVDIETVTEDIRIPLIKIVDCKTALKKYSDDMAKEKEKELLEKGLLRKKVYDTSKSEGTLKHIKLSWKIREDDLLNQKAHEIENLLKKGNKINIYIDDKNYTSKNWLEDFENSMNPTEEENQKEVRVPKKELRRRNEILDRIQTLVEELSISPVIDGDITTRIVIHLVPKPGKKEKIDKHNLKEERKRVRQEKLEKRIQKKKERLEQE